MLQALALDLVAFNVPKPWLVAAQSSWLSKTKTKAITEPITSEKVNHHFQPAKNRDLLAFTNQRGAKEKSVRSVTLKTRWRDTNQNQYRTWFHKEVPYLIFRATCAALIRGRRLFNIAPDKFTFFYILIKRYTFYLLIFLWTDT